jgi:hypothetical protein
MARGGSKLNDPHIETQQPPITAAFTEKAQILKETSKRSERSVKHGIRTI